MNGTFTMYNSQFVQNKTEGPISGTWEIVDIDEETDTKQGINDIKCRVTHQIRYENGQDVLYEFIEPYNEWFRTIDFGTKYNKTSNTFNIA